MRLVEEASALQVRPVPKELTTNKRSHAQSHEHDSSARNSGLTLCGALGAYIPVVWQLDEVPGAFREALGGTRDPAALELKRTGAPGPVAYNQT